MSLNALAGQTLRPQAPRALARPGAPSPPSARSPLPPAAPDSSRRSQGKRRAEQPRGVQGVLAAGPGGRSRGDATAPGASPGQGPGGRGRWTGSRQHQRSLAGPRDKVLRGPPVCSLEEVHGNVRVKNRVLRKAHGFTGTVPVSLAVWGVTGGLRASSALCSLGDQGQVLAGQHTCRRAHSRASGAAGRLPQTPMAQPSLPGWDSHGTRPRFFPDRLASCSSRREHSVTMKWDLLSSPVPARGNPAKDGMV